MRASLLLVLTSAILLIFAAHSFAATFDAVADFSTTQNPNGVWSYGQTPTLGGTFSPLLAGSCGPLTGWNSSGTSVPGGSPPFIFKGTGTCGTGTPPSGQLDVHPGSSGQYADVRWTSPSAGSFAVTGLFQGIDPVGPTTTDVHVLLNGAHLFDGPITSFGVPLPFNVTGAVAAGGKLDFIVGFGSDNNFGFDSTGLSAHISFQPSAAVHEPGSLMLLGSGVITLGGLSWRRHRRK